MRDIGSIRNRWLSGGDIACKREIKKDWDHGFRCHLSSPEGKQREEIGGKLEDGKDDGVDLRDVITFFCKVLRNDNIRKCLCTALCVSSLSLACYWSSFQYTPWLDVVVYCAIYGLWITQFLPWVIARLDRQTTWLIIGIFLRLFASDLSVMAWGHFRGHRDVLQRSLGLRPLLEPSLSWLPDIAYSLRLGVVAACVLSASREVIETTLQRIQPYVFRRKLSRFHYRRLSPPLESRRSKQFFKSTELSPTLSDKNHRSFRPKRFVSDDDLKYSQTLQKSRERKRRSGIMNDLLTGFKKETLTKHRGNQLNEYTEAKTKEIKRDYIVQHFQPDKSLCSSQNYNPSWGQMTTASVQVSDIQDVNDFPPASVAKNPMKYSSPIVSESKANTEISTVANLQENQISPEISNPQTVPIKSINSNSVKDESFQETAKSKEKQIFDEDIKRRSPEKKPIISASAKVNTWLSAEHRIEPTFEKQQRKQTKYINPWEKSRKLWSGKHVKSDGLLSPGKQTKERIKSSQTEKIKTRWNQSPKTKKSKMQGFLTKEFEDDKTLVQDVDTPVAQDQQEKKICFQEELLKQSTEETMQVAASGIEKKSHGNAGQMIHETPNTENKHSHNHKTEALTNKLQMSDRKGESSREVVGKTLLREEKKFEKKPNNERSNVTPSVRDNQSQRNNTPKYEKPQQRRQTRLEHNPSVSKIRPANVDKRQELFDEVQVRVATHPKGFPDEIGGASQKKSISPPHWEQQAPKWDQRPAKKEQSIETKAKTVNQKLGISRQKTA